MERRTFTHLALIVSDVDASTDFYGRYAGMEIVHERALSQRLLSNEGYRGGS